MKNQKNQQNPKNLQKLRYFIVSIIVIFIIFLIMQFKTNNTSQCDYSLTEKNYIGKSKEECSRIQFLCAPGFQQFDDECGCGCEPTPHQKNYCTEESRNADDCITPYRPVCGFFDTKKIACKKFPCAETYSNSCFACSNSNVEY